MSEKTPEEWEASARKWFDISKEMKVVQDELTADLELALNLCQDYQRCMAMLQAPDPHIPEIRRLFQKYNMVFFENTHSNYGVYLDGEDISNPEGTENVTMEVDRVELIIDADDKLHFIPPGSDEVGIPNQEWDAEDIEPVEDADLEWLKEDNAYTDEEVAKIKSKYPWGFLS